ncbi:MAG: 4-(cytidine 5'-diphospho)-2-C-methyl-D-erythritol kinase [Treponema sp.]|jgi:4-diphosphocytidyl-2-C-methyl-D-erythritol kinase|nr:4-(cytidine 5'-diphospho)-2-C-methyl-D-erythritol kinase [Treponema sp.]
MEKLTLFAPAKVNLHLAVKDRRNDGFHNLESLFLAVNFGDTLHFQLFEGKNEVKIDMVGTNPPIPPQKNIIFRALSLFKDKTGFDRSIEIAVEKRIPVGGGLGGGSSDAAVALLALNKLAGSPCDRKTLLEMALSLGSDVPFFLHETAAAWVTGRGEFIRPLNIPPLFLVLSAPGFPSGTAAAFNLLDRYRAMSKKPYKEDTEPQIGAEIDFDKNAFKNDFLPVFEGREKTAYDKIISRLKELGAVYANLSGAGSACFGVFNEMPAAQTAAQALCGDWDFVEVCQSL